MKMPHRVERDVATSCGVLVALSVRRQQRRWCPRACWRRKCRWCRAPYGHEKTDTAEFKGARSRSTVTAADEDQSNANGARAAALVHTRYSCSLYDRT